MANQIDIIIKAVDQASGVINKVEGETKGLGSSVGSLVNQYGGWVAILTAVGTALTKSYTETAKYNAEIRDLSLISGQGAEETSRFLQVLDDYELSAQDATVAAKALKDQGLTPTIETLAKLADQYKKIKDPAEKMIFIQENLGKGGAKWVNVLNQESDALLAAADSVNKYLIKTDEQIKKSEIARLALDDLSDTWAGYRNAVGDAMTALVVESKASDMAMQSLADQGIAVNQHTRNTQEYKDALAEANAEMLSTAEASLEYSESLKDQEEAAKAAADAAKELSDSYSAQIGLINNIQKADEAYTEKSSQLSTDRAEKEAELATLRAQGYWEYGEQIQGAIADLEDIKAQELSLADERAKQTTQFVSNLLAENLARDGWTTAEFEAFAKQQEAWGLWSTDAVANAQAVWAEAQRVTDTINAMPTSHTTTFNLVTVGAPPNLNITTPGAARGTSKMSHATGGDFMIPMSYGNEGFAMGNGDTASGGERVSITPKGQQAQQPMMDYKKMGREIVRALQQAGG